eukprot:gene27263-32933_t
MSSSPNNNAEKSSTDEGSQQIKADSHAPLQLVPQAINTRAPVKAIQTKMTPRTVANNFRRNFSLDESDPPTNNNSSSCDTTSSTVYSGYRSSLDASAEESVVTDSSIGASFSASVDQAVPSTPKSSLPPLLSRSVPASPGGRAKKGVSRRDSPMPVSKEVIEQAKLDKSLGKVRHAAMLVEDATKKAALQSNPSTPPSLVASSPSPGSMSPHAPPTPRSSEQVRSYAIRTIEEGLARMNLPSGRKIVSKPAGVPSFPSMGEENQGGESGEGTVVPTCESSDAAAIAIAEGCQQPEREGDLEKLEEVDEEEEDGEVVISYRPFCPFYPPSTPRRYSEVTTLIPDTIPEEPVGGAGALEDM